MINGTILGGSSMFMSSKAYSYLLCSVVVSSPVYRGLWNSSCLPKRNSFWLAMRDRLSIRELLKIRNMDLPSHNCVLSSRCRIISIVPLFGVFICYVLLEHTWTSTTDSRKFVGHNPSFQGTYDIYINKPFFMEIIIGNLDYSKWYNLQEPKPFFANRHVRFQKEISLGQAQD